MHEVHKKKKNNNKNKVAVKINIMDDLPYNNNDDDSKW